MNTIGKENTERIIALVEALIDVGSSDILEDVFMSIPKSIIETHNHSIEEIEGIVMKQIDLSLKTKNKKGE